MFSFKYLDSLLSADANHYDDVTAKIVVTMTRCGQLCHMLTSIKISIKLKLRLYEAAVISILSYGSETWDLDALTRRMLNGVNSLMLAWFTNKPIRSEVREVSTSFNIIHKIRVRRLRWVGHILRMGPNHLTYQALKVQNSLVNDDNLLMDVPPHNSIDELTNMAQDRAA